MTTSHGQIESVRVHYDDLDSMGMLHNSRYALMLERALMALWDRHGYTFSNGRYGHPDAFVAVAQFVINYRSPVLGTGDIGIHLWVDKFGGSSVVYGFRVIASDGTTTCADGHRTQIRLDPETLRPTPWADETRAIYTSLSQSPETELADSPTQH